MREKELSRDKSSSSASGYAKRDNEKSPRAEYSEAIRESDVEVTER